jgi:hypothetical protein
MVRDAWLALLVSDREQAAKPARFWIPKAATVIRGSWWLRFVRPRSVGGARRWN